MNPDKPIKTRWIKFLSYFALQGSHIRKEADLVEADIRIESSEFESKLKSIFGGIEQNVPKSVDKLMTRAIRFRKQKALVKNLVESLFALWIVLSVLFLPSLVCFQYFNFYDSYNWFYLILIGIAGIVISFITIIIGASISTYFTNIQNQTTRLASIIIDFLLIGILHGTAWFLFSSCSGIWQMIGLIGFLGASFIFDILFLFNFIPEKLVDVYYYSQKVRLTDELILESTFSLVNNKDWSETFRKRNRRNNALSEIERLASLIENDWSSHIQVGDAKTEKWKQQTLKGIAAGIRKLKRELIIPSPDSAKILTDRFNQLFENLLTHNLQGFIQEDVPAERVRKKSVLQPIKQFLVALIPITAAIVIYKYEPDLLPENYNGLPMIIGSGWLILCLLLWLDPQIGDKVSLLKNGKNLFSHRSDSSDD